MRQHQLLKIMKDNIYGLLQIICAQSVTVNTKWLWVRCPLQEIKYLIFSILRFGIEAKRGVKFRHSTRNSSKIGGKWGMECLNTRFPQLILVI